ncbi:MAG TPA: amidohydrolase family protein [candidate division Zixibacteria bacterium]|nr:amidohydrolase family protein [candidate division Zixibacteria bacterium]
MRVIDADGHVLERNIPWTDLLDEPYRSRAPKAVEDNRGVAFTMIEGKLVPKPTGKGCGFVGAPRSRLPAPTRGMVDPVARLRDMDLEGIDAAVLFGTSPFLSLPFVEDKDLACAVARVYNDWLAGYCKADPRRLKGVALTAIQDPTEAVRELRRAVTELGFVAAAVPPTSASRKNLDDPDLHPFFAEAERLGVPVCIHVGAGDGVPAGTERFDHPFFTHAMAHPFEQMIAVLCVVVGGVLERFPRLRVAFMEAGAGWVPYWMERLDEHFEYLRPTVPWLTRPPSEYMRSEQMFYAFEIEEKTLPYVADFVGAERLVFASDYNHSDSKFPGAVKEVMERTDLPAETKAKLMGENAARLYRI